MPPRMEVVWLAQQESLLTASDILVNGKVGAPDMEVIPMDVEQLHDDIMKEIGVMSY